jgi:hypothetical protein
LISSYGGSLDRLLLTIPSYAVRDLSATYVDLLSKLPTHTTLVVLVHEASRSTVEGWLMGAGLSGRTEIVDVPDHLHFSVWAPPHHG